MGNLLEYSGIVAKVRAMQAKLLKPEQFEDITSMHNVTEIVSYLKETPAYAPYLHDIEESKLHRGDIEKILIQSLYGDYIRLYRFSGVEQKKFLKLYLKRYEVDLITYCFRITFNHYEEPFDLNYKKAFFDEYSDISIDKLIASRNLDELVEALKDTDYYKPLRKLRDAGTHADTLFDYDLALNLYYFTTIWKEKKKVLKRKELELFTKDSGSKIDLLNLQWIYRAKKYYNMSPADIYSILIPIHYRIRIEKFKELVECPSLDEFKNLVSKTSYAKKYNFDQSLTIEKMYSECIYNLYLSDRRRNPNSIATVNTYLFLKEEELNKLTTALECIRYGLSSRETLDYVGGVTK